MDIFSFETLTQFAMFSIPFSLGLASYTYYKSVTYRINYNKKMDTIVQNFATRLTPKYVELVEKVLENLTDSYNRSPPMSSFDFGSNLSPDFTNVPMSRAPSPRRPPTPVNRKSDKKDVEIPEFDIEKLVESDNESDGSDGSDGNVTVPPLDLTSSIVLSPQDMDVNNTADTAIDDITQSVEEEMIPELEETILRQRKLEKSLNEMIKPSSVVELD